MKKILILFSLLFMLTSTYALSLGDYEIYVNLYSPNELKVTEYWAVKYNTPEQLSDFQEKILKSSTDLTELQKINPEIRPRVFINKDKITNIKISFDEVKALLRIEYNLADAGLLKYLDYQDQIFWKFNENLFREFVVNGLFNIQKNSSITIIFYEPLIIGEVAPFANQSDRTIVWSGISSNELRIIAIEKKPPKPTFVFSNIFSENYLNRSYFYVLFIILAIILVLLIFRNKVTNGIKRFITKHSVIKPRKQINEIVDFDFVNKKN